MKHTDHAGLPALPYGYFYRISRLKSIYNRSGVRIQLRKRTWYGSKLIDWWPVEYKANPEVFADLVLHYAEKLKENIPKDGHDITELFGDYSSEKPAKRRAKFK